MNANFRKEERSKNKLEEEEQIKLEVNTQKEINFVAKIDKIENRNLIESLIRKSVIKDNIIFTDIKRR